MSRAVMQQSLEALESFQIISEFTPALAVHAIADLRAELAKPAQSKPLTTDEYTAIARGTASKYSHRSDPTFVAYTFLPDMLEDFVRTIEAAHNINEKT
jgi:hypothetical protein